MYSFLIDRLFQQLRYGRLEVRANGSQRAYGNAETGPSAVLEVHDPSFFRDIAHQGEVGLGSSYVAKKWSSPDLEDLALLLNLNVEAFRSTITGSNVLTTLSGIASRVAQSALAKRKKSTVDQSRQGMSVAYDVGEEFFSRMLGQNMLYSCAIFPRADADLEAAQQHKINVILQKLDLREGQKLLDIGCGWGTILAAARQRFGCDVHGISLAEKQINYCRQVLPEGRFDLVDYRDLPEDAQYDRIVSVGMLEHVGSDYLELYMRTVARLLKPGGRAVLHTMINGDTLGLADNTHIDSFAASTIMPVSYIPTPSELKRAINLSRGLYPVHDERFGQHYGKTMRCWRRNVLDHADEIAQLYSEEHVRVYDYIWAMSSGCFASSNFDLLQLVVEKGPVSSNGAVYDPRTTAAP